MQVEQCNSLLFLFLLAHLGDAQSFSRIFANHLNCQSSFYQGELQQNWLMAYPPKRQLGQLAYQCQLGHFSNEVHPSLCSSILHLQVFAMLQYILDFTHIHQVNNSLWIKLFINLTFMCLLPSFSILCPLFRFLFWNDLTRFMFSVVA